jgi:phosphoribosylanthranilate isomerase
MEPTAHPRVKICCISSLAEARLAVRCGAAALGLVSAMPSGPGVIDEETIFQIAVRVPPPVATFLLTSLTDTGAIIAQHGRCRTSTIQLVDRLERGTHSDLRAALPGIALVQVVHVTGDESFAEAVAVASQVDAILLDSGNPSLAIKELGGTGRRHDWAISRRIREVVDVPIFLAGGLRSTNVNEAIEQVGPFALDLCNGVRTDGELDESKLKQFFRKI